jgi:hypothetical protein
MTTPSLLSLARSGLVMCLFFVISLSAVESRAADQQFQVQLVWGTDGEKPKEPSTLKEVDQKLLEKFKGIFKWKNYFEVSRKRLSIPKNGVQKLRLSDKCDIQVQDLGNSRMEIQLFGEGKLVLKGSGSYTREGLIVGGDVKNETAWFVVLTPR